MKIYSLAQAANQIGMNYDRLWYYFATKHPNIGQMMGRYRYFTESDISQLRQQLAPQLKESK